jgi:UDP-N-acetylglucosamine transferase subunit ALG13
MTTPRIVVIVGTDHHPFDRLIGWVNDWLDQHPAVMESAFVQSGSAAIPPRCAGSEFLQIDQLDKLLDNADVIICHGGPASIADAWRRGQIPIVVPRRRQLGEHVDDHQVDFCVKFAGLGRIRLAQQQADLTELLDEAMTDLTGFRSAGPEPAVDAAVARFGILVDQLISSPRRRLPLFHRTRRIRRGPIASSDVPADAGALSPELGQATGNHGPPGRVSVSASIDSFAQKEQE